MLEYIFFDQRARDGFVRFVQEKGLDPVCEADDEVWKVLLPEGLQDELSERVEARYDEMMALDQALFESEGRQEELGYHAAGITLALKDGESVYAQVDPLLLGRIMEVVSAEEFNSVVNAIVEAVENPDARSLCQRMRDAKNPWE